MPYLNSITEKINNHLADTTLKDKRFQGSDYNAIAYPLEVDNRDDKQQILPCIPKVGGEYKGLFFDDAKPLIIYHKIVSKQYQQLKAETYGRGSGKPFNAVSNMQMIVLANRALIKVLPEDLETLLVLNFPDGSEKEMQGINTALTQFNIRPTSSDLNYERLWTQEFKGYEFEVNADRAMLSVNYTIESAFKTKCFSLCDCTGYTDSN